MLDQINSFKHNKAERRDAVKADGETLREQLSTKSKVLEDLEHDVEHLQQTAEKLMGKVAGASAAPKRAGEAPQGLKAIRSFVDAHDACLTAPEYIKYKAEADAASKPPVCPLKWHLLSELGNWTTSRWGRRPSELARQALEGSTWRKTRALKVSQRVRRQRSHAGIPVATCSMATGAFSGGKGQLIDVELNVAEQMANNDSDGGGDPLQALGQKKTWITLRSTPSFLA